LKKTFRFYVSTWLPVLIGLCVIAMESTDQFSSANTHGMLFHLFASMGIHPTTAGLESLNHVLRKTGHFLGYGVLSLLFWRAWRRTLQNRATETLLHFRLRCAGFALLGTLITASLDEWHQSFIPSRTASPVDVALDMTGALACHLLLFIIFWVMGRPRPKSGRPEAYA
jgi:VanZ family protein